MKATTKSPPTPTGRDRALRLRRRLRASVAAGSLAAVVALGFAAEQTHRGTAYATTVASATATNTASSATTTRATPGATSATTPTATATPGAVSSAGSGSAVVVSGGS